MINCPNNILSYFIKDILSIKKGFPDYRNEIIKRFDGLKYHLLQPHQKTFMNFIQGLFLFWGKLQSVCSTNGSNRQASF